MKSAYWNVNPTKTGTTFLLLFVILFNVIAITFSQQLPAYCGQEPGLLKSASKVSARAPSPTLQLRQVHTFIRHGDRLPASSGSSPSYGSCWPGDSAVWNCTLNYDEIPDITPNAATTEVPRLYRKVYDAGRNVYPGNCMMGQLTQYGYQQEVQNGKNLRVAYIEQFPLLNGNLNVSEIYIRSDDEPRTVQSAHSLILGMFAPNETTNIAEMVDVHTMDYQVDPTSVNTALCPKLADVWNASFTAPAYVQHLEDVTAPLIAALETALGYSPVDVMDAFDCVNTHLCHGFPVPAGLTTDLYNQLVAENVYQFNNLVAYPNATYNSQLNIGFYLQEFYGKLNSFVNGTNQDIKFYLWSGHDVTLFAIMVAMDFFDNQWPPYAAMLNFELYQNTTYNNEGEEWFVRILYNGNEMTLPACGNASYCGYSIFSKFLQTLMPVNTQECATTSASDPIFRMHPLEAHRYIIQRGIHKARK